MKLPRIRIPSLGLRFEHKISLVAIFGVVGILMVVSTGINIFLRVEEFNNTKEIKHQNFGVTWPKIWIEDKKADVQYLAISDGSLIDTSYGKEITEEDKVRIMKESGYYKILSGIRILESSNNAFGDGTGHHVDCSKVGMSNEFGFRALDDYCFKSFEDSVKVVTKWIEAHLDSMNLNSTLCYYNTGRETDVCEYAKAYHNLDEAGRLAAN